jgi:hypothetical protein
VPYFVQFARLKPLIVAWQQSKFAPLLIIFHHQIICANMGS